MTASSSGSMVYPRAGIPQSDDGLARSESLFAGNPYLRELHSVLNDASKQPLLFELMEKPARVFKHVAMYVISPPGHLILQRKLTKW